MLLLGFSGLVIFGLGRAVVCIELGLSHILLGADVCYLGLCTMLSGAVLHFWAFKRSPVRHSFAHSLCKAFFYSGPLLEVLSS